MTGALSAAVLALAGCGGSGGGNPTTDGPTTVTGVDPGACRKVFSRKLDAAADSVVLVFDATASRADVPLPPGLAADLAAVSRKDGSLTVIGVDGDGAAPDIVARQVALSTPGDRSRPSVESLATAVTACVQALYLDPLRPRAPGTDLQRAMATAAPFVRSGTRLWTISDMVPTAGPVRLTPELLAQTPQQAARRAAARAPIDLHGTRWHVAAAGNTSSALLPANQEWVAGFAAGLCAAWHATGCSDIRVSPVNPVRSDSSGLPADPLPAFPAVAWSDDREGCTFEVPASLTFAGDSAALRPDAEEALAKPLALLQQVPEAIALVVGHTASSARYTPGDLQRLSQQRAEAVATWFRAHGVAAERLTAHGVGDSQPLGEDIDPTTGRQIDVAAARERRVAVTVKGAPCSA